MLSSYLIQYACAKAYYNDACHKGTEAFVKQTGFESATNGIETYSQNKVKTIAHTYLGDDGVKYTLTVYSAYHAVVTRTITLPCPTFGLADSITSESHLNSTQLNVRWKF